MINFTETPCSSDIRRIEILLLYKSDETFAPFLLTTNVIQPYIPCFRNLEEHLISYSQLQ